eukprot:COSAG02_NODE_1098_length_14587_cov_9.462590_6_plen_101_part_00
MSHRDVPAACLGVLLPPARAPAVLGSGVCASDWRPESCRTTAQAGQWVGSAPLYKVRAQQWLGFGGQRARLEFLLPSHTAIGTDHIWAMHSHSHSHPYLG